MSSPSQGQGYIIIPNASSSHQSSQPTLSIRSNLNGPPKIMSSKKLKQGSINRTGTSGGGIGLVTVINRGGEKK